MQSIKIALASENSHAANAIALSTLTVLDSNEIEMEIDFQGVKTSTVISKHPTADEAHAAKSEIEKIFTDWFVEKEEKENQEKAHAFYCNYPKITQNTDVHFSLAILPMGEFNCCYVVMNCEENDKKWNYIYNHDHLGLGDETEGYITNIDEANHLLETAKAEHANAIKYNIEDISILSDFTVDEVINAEIDEQYVTKLIDVCEEVISIIKSGAPVSNVQNHFDSVSYVSVNDCNLKAKVLDDLNYIRNAIKNNDSLSLLFVASKLRKYLVKL